MRDVLATRDVSRSGGRANGAPPTGAVAGEIREKGPARVQSRRRRPPKTRSPPPARLPQRGVGRRPAGREPSPPGLPPGSDAGEGAAHGRLEGEGGRPREAGARHAASGGGEGWAAGRLLPQPRLEPSPASHPSPTDPALRANPYPEVTDLTCRLPLPTLVYRPEASHLGDLLRIRYGPARSS